MTDITDDIAEEISLQGFEDDCRLLGNLLNDVLQREVGPHFMEKLERTRVLAQVSFRFPPPFNFFPNSVLVCLRLSDFFRCLVSQVNFSLSLSRNTARFIYLCRVDFFYSPVTLEFRVIYGFNVF